MFNRRTIMLNRIKFALPLAIALGVGLTFPAMAQSHYYEPGDNGSVWSNYPGYTDDLATPVVSHRQAQRHFARSPRDAYARSISRSRSRVDNPPGSRYQTRGNNESMGCPC
jgi:hypothetical protein